MVKQAEKKVLLTVPKTRWVAFSKGVETRRRISLNHTG
jgi:hypothetical protein